MENQQAQFCAVIRNWNNSLLDAMIRERSDLLFWAKPNSKNRKRWAFELDALQAEKEGR